MASKRYTKNILCLLILPFFNAILPDNYDLDNNYRDHNYIDDSWDIFDDPNLENDLMIDGFLNMASLHHHQKRSIPVKDFLGLLKELGAFNILTDPFYCRTNPFAIRSLLDLPIFEVHRCYNPNKWVFGGHLFWNHMDRSVFTCKNTNINSYLNLNQTFLFDALKNPPDIVAGFVEESDSFKKLLEDVDFDEIINLMSCFTVQQRRVGFMFHAWRQWDRTEIRMLMPLYYVERNMFTDPVNQQRLEEKFGVLTEKEQNQFEKNHGISDRFGLGDLRFECDYAIYKDDTSALRLGALATLPTNVAIKKGLKGTTFDSCLKQPTLDLQGLADLIDEDFTVSAENQKNAQDLIIGDICNNKTGFTLGILDRLNAILLDTSLGNDRHTGIGFLFRADSSLSALLEEYSWSENITFNSRASLEYTTPANEICFFAKRSTISDFTSRDFESDDEEIKDANLAFIETELVDKFYAYALKTNVKPGLKFRMTSRWCFNAERWDFNMGSDFWLQRKESFGKICAKKSLLRTLDIEGAKKPYAYQIKYYGSAGFKVEAKSYTMFFSINAEGTTFNKGIGKDWTVSINMESNF